MAKVQVGAQSFDVYCSRADADRWLTASLHFESWNAATLDMQARYLVVAARNMDTLVWIGGLDTPAQRLLAVSADADRPEGTPPRPDGWENIRNAAAEWAGLMSESEDNAAPADEAQPLTGLQAGNLGVEFGEARPTTAPASVSENAVVAARLNMPTAVFALLKPMLVYSTGERIPGGGLGDSQKAFAYRGTAVLPTRLDEYMTGGP